MRRSIAGLAGTLALALTVTACGSDEPSNSDSAESGGDKDLTAQLTWWDTSDAANEAPTFDALIEKFNEEYPNVEIKHQLVPFEQAQGKFKTAAAAGKGAPDILRAEVAWVPEFAKLGYLYALDGTSLTDDTDDFLEAPLSSNVFDDKQYGVPQVTDTLALLYNKKLLEEAGVEAPTTWEEVATASRTIKQETGVDGFYSTSQGYFMLPYLYGEGGDLVDTETQEILVNSEANVKGLQTAQDLVKSGAAVKPVANDPYGTMMTLFKEGKVAMIMNGPWEVKNISDDPAFGGFENLGVAPVPAGSAGQGAPVGGHNYVIWSGMDDAKAEAATAFVEFMSSAESQAFIADELGLLPTRTSAYDLDLVKDNERVTAFAEAIKVAKARPWIPEGGGFFAPMDVLATEIMVSLKDVQAAADKAAKTFKQDVVPDYTLN